MKSESLLSFKVITPEGSLLEIDSLLSVNVPLADDCPIGIRPGHAPLIAETKQGRVSYRSSDDEKDIELHAGVLEIWDNSVVILTSGNLSAAPLTVAEPTETEYHRLIQTLIEKLDSNQD
jgi:F0F1-type ATP synthase epsilon subunit